MAELIRIKKVKYIKSQEKIKIEYRRKIETHEDDLVGLFSDIATPEFYKAIEDLNDTASSICEFTENMKDRLSVYGVTFHYSKDGTMSAMLHCKLIIPTSNQEIKLDTPMRKCPLDENKTDTKEQYLSDIAIQKLWNLEAETKKYLAGKRAQGSLFENEKKQEPKTKKTAQTTPVRAQIININEINEIAG